MSQIIKQRIRYFLAVEGESEQSFIAWLQMASVERELQIHLDSVPLGGGGFKSMLEKAVREHNKRCRTKGEYQDRFLIVDEDRAGQGDWSVEKLRQEAAKHNMIVCVQRPNHEGLLYRLIRGHEREIPRAALAETKLKIHWPSYQKPTNAQTLARHYTFSDLLRVANIDTDLATLLKKVGLI